jgi:TonB family protein
LKNREEGRTIVRFVVTEKGGIDQVSVIRSANAAFDAEALRIVHNMPGWKPAVKAGKAVAYAYELPVSFHLPRK